MKTFNAFMKKELMHLVRSAGFYVLAGIFLLHGITNPLLTKATPMLLELLATEDLGFEIAITSVSALDSWAQFYKNLSMLIIAFVCIYGRILTGEYSSGTLILPLTKGLERYKIVIAKWITLSGIWSLMLLVCSGINYIISECFWDNSVANSLMLSIFCSWLFGMLIVSLIIFFSTVTSSSAFVILGSLGFYFISTIFVAIPKINKFLPSMLADSTSLVYGLTEAKDYFLAIAIASVLTIALFVISIPMMNKKQL